MTSENSDINSNALGIFIESVLNDSTIPEDLKAGIRAAAESEDAEQIAGLRDLIRSWVETDENHQNSTE